jgi:hypothetical protein
MLPAASLGRYSAGLLSMGANYFKPFFLLLFYFYLLGESYFLCKLPQASFCSESKHVLLAL